MKVNEKGFTLIELIVAAAITALIGVAAATATIQVINGTDRNNNHITAVSQIQNAGHWISHDTNMANEVVIDGLTPPNFLILNWTELDNDMDLIYHSATYYFDDLTDGIGKLKRTHWSSAGANEQNLVANYIYYEPDDPENTSQVSYQQPVITLQVTALFGDITEAREYKMKHRPNT